MAELPEPLEPTAEKARILLVDDAPANLVVLRAIIEAPDFDLVEARSGEEALGRLKEQEFAVVLLDVRMPGLGGFDTAKLIRADERSHQPPIIFLTAEDIDRAQVEAGYALGAVDFFVKPLSPVVVQAKVRGFARLFQEKQRAKNEADQLRQLVQGTIDYAIFMLDPHGRVVTWNAGAERIKGYKAVEIIGQHFSQFYPQDAIDRGWPDHELRVATAEGRFEDEGWRLRKDGSQLWANVVISALRDEKGQLRGFSKVTRDLTERKQAEESLRRSEERFRHMVEGVRDYAIFMLDPHGHVATWNAGAERIKGYKADEIIGQHFSQFYPQDVIDRGWPDHELKVAAVEGMFEDEGWRVRKDGSQFWANVVITALQDERGKLLGFSKITRDLTARKQAEENARRLAEEAAARQVAHQERERLRVTLESIGDAVISTDAQGRVTFLNPVAESLVGWGSAEAAGCSLEDVFCIVNEETRQPVENPALRALRDGKIVGLANHTVLISKDGSERPIDDSAAPIRDATGDISGSVLVFRDISERKRGEEALAERMCLITLNAAVGEALVQADGLGAMLHRCAEALVKHLDGAFARIWTLNEAEAVLELRASAGMYTHLDGPHSRVPVGKYKIGLIAQERLPHLTNAVVGDARVSDQEWAKREGMVAFAGYPLVVEHRLVGVMAMFARRPLTEATLGSMASVADEIAIGIERKTAQERLHEQREWLRVTLASIGDAMIATDMQGRVTFINGVAADLTGWKLEQAQGQPLETVFSIVNEQTRQPVENPVEKVLREGVIVGMANHTVLVARDGSERPIDDSAAPIRDTSGKMIGVVLIFRDVAEQRQAEQELRASEARKSAILETALDCVITMDHHGKVVEFNPAAERTFGYSRAEVIGRELADFIIPPSLRKRHQQGMAHYLATGEGPVLGKRLELPALHADGSEFPVELAITRISTDGPPLFTAYLRDISQRTRAEHHRIARLAVTHALAQAATVEDGIDGVLRAVGDSLAWDVGFCWTVSDDGKTLVCRRSWHRADVAVNGFEATSFNRTFNRGEGLPGHVWSTGRPRWLLDVVREGNFTRAASAAEYGLHSAFACPVMVNDRILGVIEFFTKRLREPDDDLLEMMGTVTGNIGQFIERKAAEEGLREQTLVAQTLNRIGTILAAELDLDKIVQAVTDEGTALTGAEFGAFFYNVPDEQGGSYLLYALSGVSREAFAQFPLPRNTAIFSPTFRGEGTVRLADVTKDPRFGQNAPYHGMPEGHLPVKSYLAVPVVSRSGEVLGGLFFGHSQVGVFTERHERILVGVAAQAAIAIDNSRLYQRTQDSEERFRQLAEHIQDVFWMADPHKPQVLYVSPAYERLWGRSRLSLYEQPRSFVEAVHPDDRQRAIATLERQARGEPTTEEYRVVRPDGSVLWVLDRAFPIRDGAGKVYRVAGIAEDITERKHAEELSRFLTDASSTLATVVDYESTLQKVAGLAVPAFADWCAVDLVEASGSLRRLAVVHVDAEKVRLASELNQKYPPDQDEAHGAYRVMRTGEPEFVGEIGEDVLVEIARDEEHLRILRGLGLKSFICVPLRSRSKILGVLTFVYAESGRHYEPRDLSLAVELARRAAIAIENASLYQELREADRRKDEFLATLAHELRNPLAPIRNGLQVLRLAGSENRMVAEARLMMERQLSQMVRLVDDLLDVSRITRNKLDLRKERVELAAVVHSAVETSRPLIEQAGHTFALTLPSVPVYLDADLTRLAQVFSNLLNNSAKYTESGGTISLIGEVTGGEVAVRVRDNGLGIPADALPRIFEMFSQVDRNREWAQGGLGIGLTLVRRLVEMHGGTVEARSDGPGRGSEFTVRLPVLKDQAAGQQGPTTDDGSAAVSVKRRILIVDDNQDSAMSLGMMLKLMGNDTRIAHDGLAAVEAAEQFQPDIILLDIGLPKLNGYDACRRIRQQPWSNGMVIVALTGWGQEEDRRRSQEAGFNHHLVKPVEFAALQTLLTGD